MCACVLGGASVKGDGSIYNRYEILVIAGMIFEKCSALIYFETVVQTCFPDTFHGELPT